MIDPLQIADRPLTGGLELKRSIVLALASVPMMLATGMASTAHAADDPEGSDKGGSKVTATTYVGDPVDLVPNENATATVQCPEDETAVGGGGITNATDAVTAYLTDSYPIDANGDPAAEGTSATGWAVSATYSEPDASLTAYVVCLDKKRD
ncbi:hypothetical protein ACQEVG_08060 [Streptomyces sp. CA-135486]|uniref:hypothetical protein n=1 Tax=Streptomyces sp. CA-135486 TaxID=3240049 RepID=UPI003D8EC242